VPNGVPGREVPDGVEREPNLEAKTGCSGFSAGFPEPPEPFNEHWLAQEGRLAVYQVIEELIVGRRGQIEEFLNGGLFSAGIPPPLALKIQDPKFEFGQSGGTGRSICP